MSSLYFATITIICLSLVAAATILYVRERRNKNWYNLPVLGRTAAMSAVALFAHYWRLVIKG